MKWYDIKSKNYPSYDKRVLITNFEGKVLIGKLSSDWGWLNDRGIPEKVAAWAELPQPYEAELI